jgi:hypothetical protein
MITRIDRIDRRSDLGPALLHVVIGPDADRGNAFLRADNMLHRLDKLHCEAAMGNQDQADHARR